MAGAYLTVGFSDEENVDEEVTDHPLVSPIREENNSGGEAEQHCVQGQKYFAED